MKAPNHWFLNSTGLILLSVYNQMVITYLNDAEVCDANSSKALKNFRRTALNTAYFMFVLFLILLVYVNRRAPTAEGASPPSAPESAENNDSVWAGGAKASPSPPSRFRQILKILFVLSFLIYNSILLNYILKTESCNKQLSLSSSKLRSTVKIVTIISIVVDCISIVWMVFSLMRKKSD